MSGSFRQSYVWKKKRSEIKQLYNNHCAVCGSTENCEAHHIISLSVLPQLRLDNDNLILLCSHCHKLAHNGIISSTNLINKVKART